MTEKLEDTIDYTDDLSNYLLGLVKGSNGMTYGDIINAYTEKYGLPKSRSYRTKRKGEIDNKVRSLEKLGQIEFKDGMWFYCGEEEV